MSDDVINPEVVGDGPEAGDTIDAEFVDVADIDVEVGPIDPDAEDVIDAELIDDDLDAEWSTGTGLATLDDQPDPAAQVTATVEDLPQLGDKPGPARVTSDSAAASAGVGGGLGGGKLTNRCRRCRRNPCQCRGRTGGGGGGGGTGGGRHYSILGGLHLFSGNRADASVLRAGPIASPSVTGIATGGRRPNASGARRPLRD